jgi:hypothetical protein
MKYTSDFIQNGTKLTTFNSFISFVIYYTARQANLLNNVCDKDISTTDMIINDNRRII